MQKQVPRLQPMQPHGLVLLRQPLRPLLAHEFTRATALMSQVIRLRRTLLLPGARFLRRPPPARLVGRPKTMVLPHQGIRPILQVMRLHHMIVSP